MPRHLTFFGHSAFRVTTSQGLKIWIDPWLDNPQAPKDLDPGVADLVLITHAHGDHLGNCPALARSPATEVVAIHEIQQYLLAKGLPNVTGMNLGGTYVTKGITVTMVPAWHSSSIQEGRELIYGGEAAGFVIRLADRFSLYHAGDTALFRDMALIGNLYRPRIVLLPIGSHYVMGPREASYACKLIRPEKVIPMHYGTFPAMTGTLEDFAQELSVHAPEVEMIALKPGEDYEF